MRSTSLRLLALVFGLMLLVAACEEEDPVEPDDEDPEEEEEPEDDEPDEEEPEEEEEEDEAEEPDEDAEAEETEDDALELGYLLPETGDLAFLGEGMIAATELAVERMNEAGGVLDNDVTLEGRDEAGEADIASESADDLLATGVDAVVGAAATGMSVAVIDQITGSEVVQCSPSNTGPIFTDYDDGGYYFRTAPTDALQGPVLADEILADGYGTVAIAARGDDYGEGLADAVNDAVTEAGGEVLEQIIYDVDAATFDAEVEQLEAAGADAVVIVSFEEGVQLLQTMIEAGLGPDDIGVYGADGIREGDFAERVDPDDPNVLDGLRGTAPDPSVDEDFLDDLAEYAGELEAEQFAPQAYDCANLAGLAALAGESADSQTIQENMIDVTTGDTECASFEECAGLLEDGESIAYVGTAGPYEFTDAGEPSRGTYEVWEWIDGELEGTDQVEADIEVIE
ncbi:amino acid ABC transporter substrate-binding protein [Egibacter rhizosphaerae]|uniref:Amino acid ABC transporter substrate-binding protein n=2 Tax=Egibacter rhizosphaerae TaxID=1670831 RepID=A0A411YLT9_9ACTN|nr:amino acid ABC transporter substrate-binding protein [Egibacter rhizosphaerae]